MSDHAKKHEADHAPMNPKNPKNPKNPMNPKKDSEGHVLSDVTTTRRDTAAADKSKRESGKDKEQHKR